MRIQYWLKIEINIKSIATIQIVIVSMVGAQIKNILLKDGIEEKIIMAEFEKITKDWCKMCEEVDCLNCRIHIASYHSNQTCRLWVLRHPKEAERIITQWSAEHSESAKHTVMTNGEKFKEVFGFAAPCILGEAELWKWWLDKEYEK